MGSSVCAGVCARLGSMAPNARSTSDGGPTDTAFIAVFFIVLALIRLSPDSSLDMVRTDRGDASTSGGGYDDSGSIRLPLAAEEETTGSAKATDPDAVLLRARGGVVCSGDVVSSPPVPR